MKIYILLLTLLCGYLAANAQTITVIGSTNVEVKDFDLETALKLVDSINNIKILAIISIKDEQIDSLKNVVEDYRQNIVPELKKKIAELIKAPAPK